MPFDKLSWIVRYTIVLIPAFGDEGKGNTYTCCQLKYFSARNIKVELKILSFRDKETQCTGKED